MADKIIGGLTTEAIERLKTKHGPLTLFTIDEETESPIHLWFKKPNMRTLSAVMKISENDPLAGSQLYFKECLAHGDQTVCDDVELFSAVAPHLQDLVKVRTVAVKNF